MSITDPHYSRRAVPPSAAMIWSERLREWSGGLLTIICVLALAAGFFTWRLWQIRDAADAPLQIANAVVADKRVVSRKGAAGAGWDVTLDLNGKTVIANTYNLPLVNRLALGDTVAVAYRVGKSGQVYVAELAETKKHAAGVNPASR